MQLAGPQAAVRMAGLFKNAALRPVKKLTDKVEALAGEYEAMDDAQLKEKTGEFTRLSSERRTVRSLY